MATITIKSVPEKVLKRLRSEAEKQRRSLNQQALFMLEEALAGQDKAFAPALSEFRRGGEAVDNIDEVFRNVRDRSTTGRHPKR